MLRRGGINTLRLEMRCRFAKDKGYVAQLFNIEEDPGELTDIAAKNPSFVAEMDALLERISLGLEWSLPDGRLRGN